MKIMILALCFGLTGIASATLRAGHFQGKGAWKTPSGENGTWAESIQVKKTEHGFVLASHVAIFHKEEMVHEKNRVFNYHFSKTGFFTIKSQERVIGHGYCFGQACHMMYFERDGRHEETVHMANDTLFKMGSARIVTADVKSRIVAWAGALKSK